MPYDLKNAAANIEAFTEQGRPDRVLRQIIAMGCYRDAKPFEMLKKALDIAAAMGSDHLTDVCFAAMLEYSAGVLLRLHLGSEKQMQEWDSDLADRALYIPQALRNTILPVITQVHHHVMELTKAQATCRHLRKMGEKKAKPKDLVLKYAQKTVKVGNVA